VSATLRTANDSITRVTPLMIMLTPTSVPTHGVYLKEIQGRHRAALCAVIVSPHFRSLMEMGASPDLHHWS
jgi:hypothetical protein